MKLNKKSLLIAGAVTGIGLVGASGIGVASAATTTNTASDSGKSSLVDKIATTFGLDKTKVQAVFDSNRQEKEADHQAKIETKLTQLVKDGKLTEAQKTAILAKQKEVLAARDAERGSLKDKTASERKAYMDQQRTALEQWAKDNNIPTDYLHFVMGGGHRGMGPENTAPSGSSSSSAN